MPAFCICSISTTIWQGSIGFCPPSETFTSFPFASSHNFDVISPGIRAFSSCQQSLRLGGIGGVLDKRIRVWGLKLSP